MDYKARSEYVKKTNPDFKVNRWKKMKEREAKRSTSDGFMTRRDKFEKAKTEHKAGGPYKSAMAAVESPTFSKMHNARKDLKK